MQSTLHQERLLRQERESAAAQFEIEKLELQARCVDLEAKLRVSTQLELAPFSGHSIGLSCGCSSSSQVSGCYPTINCVAWTAVI